MIKKCAYCGKYFKPKHWGRMYCSDECKKNAYRKPTQNKKHRKLKKNYPCGIYKYIYIRFQLIYVLIVIRKDVDFTMTRQERRRLERNKNTTYTITAGQLASIAAQGEKEAFRTMRDGLNQELKEEAKEATLKAFQQTFYIPLLVLRNLGWGKVRLKRFAENMIDQMEMFEENYFNSNDVREMIKEETGLNLSFELDHKNKRSTIKVITE